MDNMTFDNLTYDSSGSWNDGLTIDCDDLTNNGIYVLFVGYVLPLLSPKVRAYGREVYSMIKNAGKVTGEIVSITEFGYEKIQDLNNNGEMIDFITRMCQSKDLNVLTAEIENLAWGFSGDTKNGKKVKLKQTWKTLLEELERLSDLNKVKMNKP